MKPRPKAKPEEPSEEWLVTYADAITLLMAFFVMMLHFKDYDAGAREQAVAAIKESIGSKEASQTPLFTLLNNVNSIIESSGIPADDVEVTFDKEGVVLEFDSEGFFDAGSAALRPTAKKVLAQITEEMKTPTYEHYFLEVEGHTDDAPISTAQFPSNWELSTARAAAVVREFVALEVAGGRLKAAGYADTRPKVPNRDMFNEPIPENRIQNRRVTLRLHP